MYHVLKLFQPGTDASTPVTIKKNLVSEMYDEIVFQEPTVLMKSLIDSIQPMSPEGWKHETDCKCNYKDVKVTNYVYFY